MSKEECEKLDKEIEKQKRIRKSRRTKIFLPFGTSRTGNALASERAKAKIKDLEKEKKKLGCK